MQYYPGMKTPALSAQLERVRVEVERRRMKIEKWVERRGINCKINRYKTKEEAQKQIDEMACPRAFSPTWIFPNWYIMSNATGRRI